MILVTGCAGFIGSHLCEYLLKTNIKVIGIDNMNDYYNINIKKTNLNILNKYDNFIFEDCDIVYSDIVIRYKPKIIVHLASLAGVRKSLEFPTKYATNNILSQINILEQCRMYNVEKYIFASSSSVYGLNKITPFNENDIIHHQNSPYATSKLCMENYANMYNTLYKIQTIGLRFFTVYGPRGRPDMAPYKFLNSIMNGATFTKFGNGNSYRDYTYISDIIDGICNIIKSPNQLKLIYNLGNSKPCTLNDFINICEKVTNKKAVYEQLENQKGDVPHTFANISSAQQDFNYNPQINLESGLEKTYEWLKTIN